MRYARHLAMLLNSKVDAAVPIIVSLFTGVSTVVSRTLNASLARQTSAMNSTLFNYIVGLSVSAAVLLIAGRGEPMMLQFSLSPKVWIYLGGIIGVGAVTLLNVTVCKISSFCMTLLLFAGQVFSGVIIDILLTNSFTLNNLIGGVAITAGLAQNLLIDKRNARAVPQCADA
jgi:transporter family-2 protein